MRSFFGFGISFSSFEWFLFASFAISNNLAARATAWFERPSLASCQEEAFILVSVKDAPIVDARLGTNDWP